MSIIITWSTIGQKSTQLIIVDEAKAGHERVTVNHPFFIIDKEKHLREWIKARYVNARVMTKEEFHEYMTGEPYLKEETRDTKPLSLHEYNMQVQGIYEREVVNLQQRVKELEQALAELKRE